MYIGTYNIIRYFQISTLVVFGYRIGPICEQIKVAYNNAYRIVMKYKHLNSASLMFLYYNVNN